VNRGRGPQQQSHRQQHSGAEFTSKHRCPHG
jgi:hypothetical protein